jgi:RNA polymerase sigma-70 factor (ECF subfamily)
MGLGFLRNSGDAEDFTQEVFLKAFRSLESFEGRSSFSTWLYQIAYRTGLNHAGRRKEYASLVDEDSAPATAYRSPEEEAVRASIKDSVRQAARELPERYRICIDLSFFYDRTVKEIERITGIPANTVKSHVLRAKKLLAEKLKGLVDKN